MCKFQAFPSIFSLHIKENNFAECKNTSFDGLFAFNVYMVKHVEALTDHQLAILSDCSARNVLPHAIKPLHFFTHGNHIAWMFVLCDISVHGVSMEEAFS